jgi:hypothetical protein
MHYCDYGKIFSKFCGSGGKPQAALSDSFINGGTHGR